MCLLARFADFRCLLFIRRQARHSLAKCGARYREALIDAKRSLQGEDRAAFGPTLLRQLTYTPAMLKLQGNF